MNPYQNGKIYKLVCDATPIVYYGSTIQTLSGRLSLHKWVNTECSSRELFKLGNVSIELVEEYPCNSKKELVARERIYIEFMLKNFNHRIICNKVIPSRTRAEYRLDNKDRSKEYYETNRDRYKEHYKVNRDKLNDRSKEYYKANRDVIREREREKITCECGSIFMRNSKSRHLKSKKHLHYLSKIANKIE